jgi:putative ATP-binding cassette transporter
VLVDGVPVVEQAAALRALWSAVFSDYHLFDQLLGPSGEPDAALLQSLSERLQLKSQLRVERGRLRERRLSSGQRKRLALLLALLEQRPLLLLDEWAADQDPALRRMFYCELLPQLKAAGATIVAITHDEQYFGVADRVLRIAEGQLQPLSVGAEVVTSLHSEGPQVA